MAELVEYRAIDELLPLRQADAIRQKVLEETAWKLHKEWFFSQYDCSWVRREFDRPPLGHLTASLQALYQAGARMIEAELNAVPGGCFTIVAHRMVEGQQIGIHNDSPEGGRGRTENCRLLFYVDPSFEDSVGGHLLLFKNRVPGEIEAAFRPHFNSAVLMQLSEASFHAIGRIRTGVRYSVVVSYWAYPVLEKDPLFRERIKKCLHMIIGARLEAARHSGTSFAWHLYNTYALLSHWGAPPEVRLAGLMHSVLGREASGVPPTRISRDDLYACAGAAAGAIVEGYSRLSPSSGMARQLDWRTQLIQVANALEQAQSPGDLRDVRELVGELRDEALTYREAIRSSCVTASASLLYPIRVV